MGNNENVSKKSIMINYGLLLAVLSILVSVTNYSFGDIYDPHWSVQVIGIALMIVLIVLGIKKYKELNEGYLSLGDAIKTGIGIAFVTTLIFMAYFYVFVKFIEPEFIATTTEINIEKVLDVNPDTPEESLEIQRNMTKDYFFIFAFGFMFIFNLFIGFVTSLIAGLAMKHTDEEITSI
jgi:hypothetical protein